MDQELIVETAGDGVAVFVLNRPSELNAWTYPLEELFFAALDSAAGDPSVRVIVVTGAGRAFCVASMRVLGDGDRSGCRARGSGDGSASWSSSRSR